MRLLVVLLFLTAGCLTDSPADSPDEPSPGNETAEPGSPENPVATGAGTITASAGGLSATQGGGDVMVADGATILFVEWAWDDPVVDLDGALSSPSAGTTQGVQNIDHTAEGGSPGSPDSPHSLTIEAPEVGTWAVSMSANGAAANTEYRYAATVFYNVTQVPESYSAL